MAQYFLKKESKELHVFPHVIEFALKKIIAYNLILLKKERLNSFAFIM
jgi:hypothetical protein